MCDGTPRSILLNWIFDLCPEIWAQSTLHLIPQECTLSYTAVNTNYYLYNII